MIRKCIMRQKNSFKTTTELYIGHLLLCMGPYCCSYTQSNSIGKNNFSFASSYQSKIVSGLGMGAFSSSSFIPSVLECHWVQTCAGLVHAAIVSVSSNVYRSCCVKRPCFHGVLYPLWFLQSFHRVP